MPRKKAEPRRERTRRRRGSGSVHWLAGLNYWCAVTPAKLGRRATYHDTRQQAEDWLARQLAPPDPGLGSDAPLGAYLMAWYDRNRPRFAERTRVAYLGCIERCEPLHRIALRDLRPSHVEGLMMGLLEGGKSQWTIKATRQLLRNALGSAVDDGLLPRLPLGKLRLPKEQAEADGESYTLAETRRLLAAAETHPLGALVTLALWLGPRIGELAALRWQDVDQAAGTLRIGRSAGRRVTDVQDKTKTRKARMLPLLLPAAEALRRHREAMAAGTPGRAPWKGDPGNPAAEPLAQGSSSIPRLSPWVFPGRNARHHLSLEAARKALREMQAAAGVRPLRFHATRHTAASLMHEAGVPDVIRAAVLGHASIRTTHGYTHVSSDLAEALARYQRALEG